METCLIPPISELESFGYGCYHLLLSHLLENKQYREHYIREKKENKAYLILDNSAHEFKSGQEPEILIEQALEIKANEIVCPDVLFDARETAANCRLALRVFAQSEKFAELKPNVMIVPQGTTYREWQWCLYDMMNEYDWMYSKHSKQFKQLPVIGLSKDYEMWEGGLVRLFERDLTLIMTNEWVTVHLLGWGRDLWALNTIAREYGSIEYLRSVDSAKPFVYAMSNTRLDFNKPIPEYPTRSENYFNHSLTKDQRQIAFGNVRIFELAAKGQLYLK